MSLGFSDAYNDYWGTGGWGGSSYGSGYSGDWAGYSPLTQNFYSPSYSAGQIDYSFPSMTPDYSGDVESVTVSTDAYSMGSPNFTSSFFSPSFTAGQIDYSAPTLPPDYSGDVEEVTVSADPYEQQVQTPNIAPAFDWTGGSFAAPFISPDWSGDVEEVTVTAPKPEQVTQANFAPDFFNPYFTAAQINAPFPALYSAPPVKPQQARLSPQPPQAKAPGGGGSGSSGGAQPKQQQQQPQQQQKPIVIYPPQQQQQKVQLPSNLLGLTPQQLAALLQNPNLTPQQRAAVQQALAQKTAGTPGGAAGAIAAAQKAAAAKPLDAKTLLMPLLIVGGVVVAWKVAHHHAPQIAAAGRTIKRKMRRLARA